MKTKILPKLTVFVFGLLLLVCFAAMPLLAVRAAGITVEEYPFEKGEDAFASSVRFYSTYTDNSQDKWMLGCITGTFNISAADYLAIQMKNNGNAVAYNAGFEYAGTRFCLNGPNETGGEPVYWVSESGAVTTDTIVFNSAHMPANFVGMLVIPMTSFMKQFGTAEMDLTKVANIHITTNALYNHWIDVTIGDIGYYDGEIGAADTNFVTVFSNDGKGASWINNNTWIAEGMARSYVKSLAEASWDDLADANFDGTFNGSPYLRTKVTGEGALIMPVSATQWEGITSFKMAAKNIGQAAKISFKCTTDDVETAITNVTAKVKNGQSAAADVEIGENGILDIPAGFAGTIEIPVTGLTKVNSVSLVMNAADNADVKFVAGVLGATKDGTAYKVMASGTTNDGFAAYKISGSTAITMSRFNARFETGTEAATLGEDIKITQNYDAMQNPLTPWTGGAPGETSLIERGEGKAMKFTVGAFDSNKDPYMAVDIPLTTAGSKDIDDWSGAKGITFYAENLSIAEVAVNVEFNLNDVSTGALLTEERFNIRFGARYYLVDIVTGREMIYIAQPVISIPVGFKGYVRVPFAAYKKAEWAGGDGILDSYDLASYMCVTCDARDYEGFEYVLDDVGVYYNAFELNTSYNVTENSVKKFMGLEV